MKLTETLLLLLLYYCFMDILGILNQFYYNKKN